MRYLADTQTIVWAKEENRNLSENVKSILIDSNNEILVSQMSFMELAIKLKLGKLPNFTIGLNDFAQQLWEDGYTFLPIKNEHIYCYQNIPLLSDHRDPFDRFLIATAVQEDVSLITSDEKFSLYKDLAAIVRN